MFVLANKKKEMDFINAGAWYKLSKILLLDASNQISNSLCLTKRESSKIYNLCKKWSCLECDVGFEDRASHNDFDSDFINVFYGPVSTDIGKEVAVKMVEILQSMIEKIENECADYDKFHNHGEDN